MSVSVRIPTPLRKVTNGEDKANRRIYFRRTDLLANTTYTMSCWMYFSRAFNSAWSKFQYDSENTGLLSEYFDSFSTYASANGYGLNEWFFWEGTLTTESTTEKCYWGPVISRTADVLVGMQRMQVEVKEHKTPFITRTRSVSGSLIDLTRTTDIDVTNVSFDSNAQITFDGTDDYIDKTRKQYTIEESWSVEVIFKPTDNTDTSWNGLFGGHLTYGGYWMFHSAGNLTYYEGHSGILGTMITYRSWTKANTFTTDDYHHLTITYTPTNATSGSYDLYYNGGEKTDSFSWAFTWSNSLDSNYIGKGDSSRYGTNDIHIYKEYNRALSAAEVKQNYNAIKDRFNI